MVIEMEYGLIFDILWHIRDGSSVMGVSNVSWYADRNSDRIGRLRILHAIYST